MGFTLEGPAFPDISSGGGNCDYPLPSNVALGVVYANGTTVGTLPCGRGTAGQSFNYLHSPAQILQELLIVLGFGIRPKESTTLVDSPWTCYATRLPDSPDSVIVVYDAAASEFGREQVAGERQEHPGFQFLIRGATHQAGYQKAQSIAIAIDQGVYHNVVQLSNPVAMYRISVVTRTGSVNVLGADRPKSNRTLFTINGTAAIRRIS